MTNAEKYLKDGVDERELFEKICLVFYDGGYSDLDVLKLEKFFNEQAKPTLTEDERVILRNIHKEYKRIERNEMGNLYVGVDYFGMYDNLFQFIKERRKIRDKGVTR